MFVKKFEALTLEKALAMIKEELGPDALVLSTRKIKKGWLQKPLVEVTAAYEKPQKGEEQSCSKDDLSTIFPHRKERLPRNVDGASIRRTKMDRYADLSPAVIPPRQKDRIQKFENGFSQLGLSGETCRELTQRLLFEHSREDLAKPLFLERAKINLMYPSLSILPFESFCSRAPWVFLGPPGAGKTSIAVKLAMLLKRKKQPVSLRSLDTRKILGVAELAAYAKTIDVKFVPKSTAQSDHASIELVDGPALELSGGRMDDKLSAVLEGMSVCLVLDVSLRLGELMKIVGRAKVFKPAAVAFTRLDQVSEQGVVFDVLRRSHLPLLTISRSHSFRAPLQFSEPKKLAKSILYPRGVA